MTTIEDAQPSERGMIMRDKRLLLGIALGGLLGGAIGSLAGGLIGALSCDWNVKEAGCLESSVYGAVIGNSIMIPIGVQVANWQRGNPSLFLLTLLVAGGIAAAGPLRTTPRAWKGQ